MEVLEPELPLAALVAASTPPSTAKVLTAAILLLDPLLKAKT